MASLKLDLMMLDTHNPKLLGIVDISTYPAGFNIVSPSLEVRVSGFSSKVLGFTPNSLNIYNSNDLGLTCDLDCTLPLPDGVVYVKYSIYPAHDRFVEKTFFRTDQIQEKFDAAFMSLDIAECDNVIKAAQKKALDEVYYYIQMSIAAANKGSLQLALNLYQKADKLLTKFLDKSCCNG